MRMPSVAADRLQVQKYSDGKEPHRSNKGLKRYHSAFGLPGVDIRTNASKDPYVYQA